VREEEEETHNETEAGLRALVCFVEELWASHPSVDLHTAPALDLSPSEYSSHRGLRSITR